MEHLGPAHDEQAVEALKAVARQRLAGGQGQLELGLDAQHGRIRPVADHVHADDAFVGGAVRGLPPARRLAATVASEEVF